MTNEIVRSDVVSNLDDLQRVAKLLAASTYFEKGGEVAVAQIATKVLAGREMGFAPFASVNGRNVHERGNIMIAGSAPDGTDLEYSPPVGKRPSRVAPPLGDVVAAQERTIAQLQNTVAHNAEELHAQRVAITSLTARIYALEQAQK